MDSYSTLFNRWLKRNGLIPSQAAARLGLSVSTAYDHAKGRSVPPATRIAHLATVLGESEAKLRRVIAADRKRLHPGKDGSRPIDATGASVVVEANAVLP